MASQDPCNDVRRQKREKQYTAYLSITGADLAGEISHGKARLGGEPSHPPMSLQNRLNQLDVNPSGLLVGDYEFALQHATVSFGDFERIESKVSEWDLVYLDRPYDPTDDLSFTKYTKQMSLR